MSRTELGSPGDVERYGALFIGGEWREPKSGECLESRNPATGQVWASVPVANAEDVDESVRSARTRFDSREWRRLGGAERGKLLRRLGALIQRDLEPLSVLESRDNGNLINESRVQFGAMPLWLDYFAGLADKLQSDTIRANADTFAHTIREPVGVVGGLTPWNSPASLFIWKLAPAIAGGNTIVIKPSEHTSVTALELAKLCAEAEFPGGSVNVVTGLDRNTGSALARHEDIDRFAFTGEGQTAVQITRRSATDLERLVSDSGGKGPHILFEDGDYDQALRAATEGAFTATGQSCICGSRMFIHAALFDRFVADLADAADGIVVGDPFTPGSQLGPRTTKDQLTKTEDCIQSALDEGAEIIAGGRREEVPGHEHGYFLRPTVVGSVNQDMKLCRDEVFGPVTAVTPFKTEEEVIELANEGRYCLTAGVWTNDDERAHRLVAHLKAGVVWVNAFRVHNPAVPYGGGMRASGYGMRDGMKVMNLFTDLKTVDIANRSGHPSRN
jgi:acyl-CoA reductase-like NAD-dependent aldehyde dehydrogenase